MVHFFLNISLEIIQFLDNILKQLHFLNEII